MKRIAQAVLLAALMLPACLGWTGEPAQGCEVTVCE